MKSFRFSVLAPITFTLVTLGHRIGHAESNEFNFHAGAGAYLHNESGPGGVLGLDWQFRPGFALDGSLVLATESSSAMDGLPSDTAITAMFGLRFRFIDDYHGYLNEPHGNAWGNLYFAPRVGLLHFGGTDIFNKDVSETSIGFSTEIGYEFSVFKPVSVGTFFRWDIGIAGSGGGGGPFNAGTFALGGVSVSIGTGKPAHTRSDLDHDGVEDFADACPNTPQGAEVNSRGCSDQDRDGVDDLADACPDTPPGSEVDTRGCTILHREMVLIGIQFRLDSADIEPSSERTLKQAAQALKDNPKAEVEIGGHTDDTGAVDHNMQLSTARAQSVANWLEANGIPQSQLTVKGYGSTVPKAANDSDEHRALNRRIEFKRLDVDVNAASARRSP